MNTELTPNIKYSVLKTTELGECTCSVCRISNARWRIGECFEAISFNILHWETEEVHAMITLYDDKIFHKILKQLVKHKGVL